MAFQFVRLPVAEATSAIDAAAVIPAPDELAAQVGQLEGGGAVTGAPGGADRREEGSIGAAGDGRPVRFQLASRDRAGGEVSDGAG